ncbi:MAG: glycosyltransferase [Nitrosopumilus sp.]|nr:MAG: glycosyltransferase [Nitrosopumilus sp.]
MTKNQVSVIIPTFNESENICNVLESIKACLPKIDIEAIVVDDNSPDGTGKIVEEYIKSMKNVAGYSISVIHRRAKEGLSSAILDGLKNSKGDTVIVMDSDMSHPPQIIPKMLETIKQTQCDIVVASRYIKGGAIQGWPFKRKLMSTVATKIAKKGLGISTDDPMSGFFAFRRKITNGVKFDAIGYKILLELLVKTKGVKVEEIPYTFTDRKRGSSKLDSSIILDYCKSVWKLYRYGKTVEKEEKRASVRFLSKAVRFFSVGASGLGINYLTSMLFTLSSDMWYLHAILMGIMFSITSNFILNKYWTFEDRDFSTKRTLIQYGKFAGFSSIGALVQLGMVYYLVDELSVLYPVSLILAVGIAAFSNFVLNKKWTFKEKVWS